MTKRRWYLTTWDMNLLNTYGQLTKKSMLPPKHVALCFAFLYEKPSTGVRMTLQSHTYCVLVQCTSGKSTGNGDLWIDLPIRQRQCRSGIDAHTHTRFAGAPHQTASADSQCVWLKKTLKKESDSMKERKVNSVWALMSFDVWCTLPHPLY